MNLKDFIKHRGTLRNIKRFGMEFTLHEQNLCEHGYSTASLFSLLCDHKNIKIESIDLWRVMQHDFAEVFTGDLNQAIKKEVPYYWEKIEDQMVPEGVCYKDNDLKVYLGHKKYPIFLFADALDAFLYTKDEIGMGNFHLLKAHIYYKDKLKSLDKELYEFIINLEELNG